MFLFLYMLRVLSAASSVTNATLKPTGQCFLHILSFTLRGL